MEDCSLTSGPFSALFQSNAGQNGILPPIDSIERERLRDTRSISGLPAPPPPYARIVCPRTIFYKVFWDQNLIQIRGMWTRKCGNMTIESPRAKEGKGVQLIFQLRGIHRQSMLSVCNTYNSQHVLSEAHLKRTSEKRQTSKHTTYTYSTASPEPNSCQNPP